MFSFAAFAATVEPSFQPPALLLVMSVILVSMLLVLSAALGNLSPDKSDTIMVLSSEMDSVVPSRVSFDLLFFSFQVNNKDFAGLCEHTAQSTLRTSSRDPSTQQGT